MPRRIQTYQAGIGLEVWNLMSTTGTFVMLVGLILITGSVFYAFRRGKVAGNDPWDGRTLEWTTTSPPPVHDFDVQPVVNSLDPLWAQKILRRCTSSASTQKRAGSMTRTASTCPGSRGTRSSRPS